MAKKQNDKPKKDSGFSKKSTSIDKGFSKKSPNVDKGFSKTKEDLAKKKTSKVDDRTAFFEKISKEKAKSQSKTKSSASGNSSYSKDRVDALQNPVQKIESKKIENIPSKAPSKRMFFKQENVPLDIAVRMDRAKKGYSDKIKGNPFPSKKKNK